MPAETNLPVTVVPIEHATGYLQWGDTALYFDPTGDAARFAALPQANIVLVTDIHGDHFSTSTLEALVGSSTTLIVPKAVADQLPEALAARATVLNNGESATQLGYVISAVPMYNLPDSENSSFHPKGRGNGYIIEKDGFRVYIAGDTAGTPEMRALTDIDIALVPMNLPYTMSVGEAADAVLAFKPKVVYPYHYRGQDGLADVARFKSMVEQADKGIQVVLAQWYPAQ
jgi:L-ascorbate metabolism protein UlaG (beta-lactamase superfamily)